MAVTSGFYNAILDPATELPDRLYDATQISELFDGVIRDGVFMMIGGHLAVSAGTGMTVQVATGRAWFNHSWINNDATLLVVIPESEVLMNRIDAIVVDIDANQSVRANTIKVVTGVPASTPARPAMAADAKHHQYPLAYIYVAHDGVEIVAANITNAIGTSECPFITGVLETMNIDALITQWNGEWTDWVTMQQTDYMSWALQNRDAFLSWFGQVRGILSGDAAGNLFQSISEHKNDYLNPHRLTNVQLGVAKTAILDSPPTTDQNLALGYDIGDTVVIPNVTATLNNIIAASWKTMATDLNGPDWFYSLDCQSDVGSQPTFTMSNVISDGGAMCTQVIISGKGLNTAYFNQLGAIATNGVRFQSKQYDVIAGHKYFIAGVLVLKNIAAIGTAGDFDGSININLDLYRGPSSTTTLDWTYHSVYASEIPNQPYLTGTGYTFGRIFDAAQDDKISMRVSMSQRACKSATVGITCTGTLQFQSPMLIDLTAAFGAGQEPSYTMIKKLLLGSYYASWGFSSATENWERYFTSKTLTAQMLQHFICGKSTLTGSVWEEMLTRQPLVADQLVATTGFTLTPGKCAYCRSGSYVYFELEITLVSVRAAAFMGQMVTGLPAPAVSTAFDANVMSTARLPVTGIYKAIMCGGNTAANAGLWFNAITATTANQILSVSGWYRAAP